jgi:hypothetical protein
MQKNLVHAALSVFILTVLTTPAYPQWVDTNWPASSSYFSLYASQGMIFARTWDSNNGGRMFLAADNSTKWNQMSSTDADIDVLSIVAWNGNILAGTWNGLYQFAVSDADWHAVAATGMPADTPIWSLAMIGNTLFAGAVGHVYESPDYGATWTDVNSGIPASARVTTIAASGSFIFAGTDSSGVFMATNGGTSWSAMNSGLTDKRISQLASAGTKLFAVTLKGVFVFDANSASWTADSSGLKNVNCLLASDSALFAGTDGNGVYISANNGQSWAAVNSGLPANNRVWSLAASGGNVFAGTSSGVWRRNPADIKNYTLTSSASVGGTISPQGNVTVYENGSQTFTFTPTLGYRISDIIVDGTSKGVADSYTISNVAANHTISVFFTAAPIYSIVATAGEGGTISPSGTVMVSETWSQKFTIAPLQEYVISSVMVDGQSVGAVSTYTFTNITGNHTISAVFSKVPYTITASAGSGGSISPSGAVTVLSGSSQTFTIAPSNGYEISNVLVDGVAVGAVSSYTFSSVTSKHTISASFNSLTSLAMYRINCGSYSAASPFTADQYYSGGSTRSYTNAIDTNGVTDPAPQAVYKAERRGTFTYTFPNLTSGGSYKVRLHLSENSYSATGKCIFNAALNGTAVLSNYDIFAETGAQYKAIVKEFTATANTAGQIVIAFTTVTDSAKVAGIEIIRQL